MNEFMTFCGFFLAHAIWSISDNSILIAFGVTGFDYQNAKLERFVNEEHYEESVNEVKIFLDKNSKTNKFTSIYFDGYYTYPNGEKFDAICMTSHFISENKTIEINMCVPYQKKSFFKKFKVFKPKLIGFNNCTDSEISNSFDYFWNGINSHIKGSEVWNKCIDQSK